METRNKKISVAKTGGNASKNSLKYSVGIPPTWVQQLKINQWERDIKMTLDGDKIIIEKLKEENEEETMNTWFTLLEKRDIYRTVICTQNLELLINILSDNVPAEYLENLDAEIENAIENATADKSYEFGIMSNNFMVVVEKIEA